LDRKDLIKELKTYDAGEEASFYPWVETIKNQQGSLSWHTGMIQILAGMYDYYPGTHEWFISWHICRSLYRQTYMILILEHRDDLYPSTGIIQILAYRYNPYPGTQV
jgi:hypothetical protein